MSVNYKACKDKKFVNPYSFIELINNELNDNARIEHGNEQKLYGYIECKIKIKTPLAILGNCSKGTDGHKVYDFFRVNGKPTIPGSSVRAMIRMSYETLTDSCLVTLKDNYAITERVSPKEAFKPGVLVRDGDNNWELYEAKRIRFKLAEPGKKGIEIKGYKFQSGDYIGIKQEKKIIYEGDLCNKEQKKYVLVIGENIERKKYESIFKIVKRLDYRSEDIERAIIELDYIVEMYQNKSINKKYEEDKGWYKTYWKEKEKGVIPVWYKVINNKLYVSKAAIGRKVFKKTVNELIDEQYRPCLCNERESLCPACSLFGTARGKGNGSKIRVTDAISEKDVPKDKIILRELSSPHIGYYLFYGKNGKTYDENNATIAGRKYYWHIPKVRCDASIYSTDVKNERNCSCELAPTNSEFSFKVYFDGITEKQLKQLIWTINIGENRIDGNYCHRIGHGKPLGLGSVKAIVNQIFCREYQNGEYKIKKINEILEKVTPEGKDLEFDEYSRECFIKVADFCFMEDVDVKYPEVIVNEGDMNSNYSENDVAPHKWFANNTEVLKTICAKADATEYQLNAVKLICEGDSKKEKGTVNYKSDVIETKVNNVDSYGNVYLCEGNGVKKNSCILSKDTNGRTLKKADKIKVKYKNESKRNDKIFYNYEMVD